jgi:hypothetical protein
LERRDRDPDHILVRMKAPVPFTELDREVLNGIELAVKKAEEDHEPCFPPSQALDLSGESAIPQEFLLKIYDG